MNDIERRLREMVMCESQRAARKEWRNALDTSEVPPYNYRGDHVELVVETALHLARAEGADERIVKLAAWLHDCAKPGLGGADDHGEEGARRAARTLREAGIDEETIERVAQAIRDHVGLTLRAPLPSLESQVLWEADKLVKLGVVGLLHYVLNGVILRPGLRLSDMAERLRKFLPLAQQISETMVTDTAKRLARERLDTLHAISRALDRELELECGE